jgi:hypothetical protein
MATSTGYGPPGAMKTGVHVHSGSPLPILQNVTPGGSSHSRPTKSTKSTNSRPYPTPSLECYNYQAIPAGGHSPADIIKALTEDDQITNRCSVQSSGSAGSIVFNNGWIYTLIQWESPRPLVYCNAALALIIDVCIVSNNTYSGKYSLGGETYIIWNAVYPKNPLAFPGASYPNKGAT